MAKKISQLSAVTLPVLTDQFEVNQGGVSKRVALAQVRELGWFNVKDYGALGTGVGDDTSFIQAAITAAAAYGVNSKGGTVYFPAGLYPLFSTLTVPDPGPAYHGVSLRGESQFGSVLAWHGPTSDEADAFDRAIAIKYLGQTEYKSGHFTLRNDTGSQGTTVGILFGGDLSVGGTNGGQCVWEQLAISSFFHGLEVGDADPAKDAAVSELVFISLGILACDVGVYCIGLNTIAITFYFLGMTACRVGVKNVNAQSIHVWGGSTSGNTADFQVGGGVFTIQGLRSENGYLLTQSTGSVTLIGVSAVANAATQDEDIDDNAYHQIDVQGGHLTLIGCEIGGAISMTGAPSSLTCIGSGVGDSNPVRMMCFPTYPWGANPRDTSPNLVQFRYDYHGSWIFDNDTLARTELPDRRGVCDTDAAAPVYLDATMLPGGALRLAEVSNLPTAAELTNGANAKDHVAVFMKNDKLVFGYNAAGTVTYLSIPLDGSTATWTHGTTAP